MKHHIEFDYEFPGLWADEKGRHYHFVETFDKDKDLWYFDMNSIRKHCVDKERLIARLDKMILICSTEETRIFCTDFRKELED